MRGAQLRNQIHSFFPKRNYYSLRLAIDCLKRLCRTGKRLHQPAPRDAFDSRIVDRHAVLPKHLEKGDRLQLRYFLTLTVDPKKLKNKKFAVTHLRLVFNKFRVYLKRKFGVAPSYICVLEYTKAGLPHLHCIFDRYIPQAWISNVL